MWSYNPDAPPIQQAVDQELEIGRRIQTSFLPRQLPQIQGWDLASLFIPARQVSGDFYDAFNLSGGRRLGLVVGDVCDKGVGSAMFMALFRSLIRAFADQNYSLRWMDVLSSDTSPSFGSDRLGRRRELLSTGTTALKNAIDQTNNYIAIQHGDTSMFATVFFGILDPATGGFMYINGGHEPPMLFKQKTGLTRLNPTGPAVGMFPNMDFAIGQVNLEPDDTFLAYTDGVLDARNPDSESFCEDRLLSIFEKPHPTSASLVEAIHSALETHMCGADQYDDITALAAKRIL